MAGINLGWDSGCAGLPGWKASTLALGPLLTFRSPPNSLPNLHCFNEGTKYIRSTKVGGKGLVQVGPDRGPE